MVADQASRLATTILPGTGSGTRSAGPDMAALEFFPRQEHG
jgi:hypothetical protein